MTELCLFRKRINKGEPYHKQDQSKSESPVQNNKETLGQMGVSYRDNTTPFTFPGENSSVTPNLFPWGEYANLAHFFYWSWLG